MRITPARLLQSALWRTGAMFQAWAVRLATIGNDREPAPAIVEDKSAPVEVLEQDGDWLVCRIDNLIWRLDPSQCIDQDLLDDGMFEPESTSWIQQIVKPGMIAVDVGANFGYYTVRLSKLVGSGGQVHAFEPSPRYRERLLDHLKRNECDNVLVSEYGLSDREEESRLYGDNVSASMHWHNDAQHPIFEETIRLKTLDRYASDWGLERLDFIKVDIDGHEPQFITGAAETLTRFRPVILMEFANICLWAAGSNAESLGQQLGELGYSLCSEKTGEPYPSHADFLRDAMNCSHSVNVLCFPKNRDKQEGKS